MSSKIALSAAQVLTRGDNWESYGIGRDEESRLAQEIDAATKMPELLGVLDQCFDEMERMRPLTPLLLHVRDMLRRMK